MLQHPPGTLTIAFWGVDGKRQISMLVAAIISSSVHAPLIYYSSFLPPL
jgi:hypothetical protein